MTPPTPSIDGLFLYNLGTDAELKATINGLIKDCDKVAYKGGSALAGLIDAGAEDGDQIQIYCVTTSGQSIAGTETFTYRNECFTVACYELDQDENLHWAGFKYITPPPSTT